MILPGNSRQVIVDAINESPIAPHSTTSKIVSDLADAGYGIINREELTQVFTGLLAIIKALDDDGQFVADTDVTKAKELRELLSV